ncbi:MAG: hypothetical protein ACSHYB_12100 [Roseibacillus sp.]
MKVFYSILFVMMGIVSAGAEVAWVSLSKVGGLKAYKGQVALFGVKEELESLTMAIRGEGMDSFAVADVRKEENGLLLLEIAFQPTVERGFFSAELVVGAGEGAQVIQLRGVAIKALEGKNEPPLQEVLDSLGAGIDVGGAMLSLSTSEKTIGDSVSATRFEPVKGGSVKLTPLARYSPPGVTPFGLAIEEGKVLRLETVGELGATSKERPDAHQTLRPPLSGGQAVVTLAEPPKRFGLFLKAHRYTSLTFPGRSEGATIEHTARIYPVKMFQGKAVKDAYVVGFEEASNGDYQDAVFLIEGVKAVK